MLGALFLRASVEQTAAVHAAARPDLSGATIIRFSWTPWPAGMAAQQALPPDATRRVVGSPNPLKNRW
jgi:hypothetical protein